jgi:cytoskeleton protein RodZ
MQELVISAKPNEVCWVQVNDGQKTKSFTLKNSETRRIEFATTAKVRLGNAGGVTFRLNGSNHPYDGQRGMTDTVEFGGR